LPAVADSAAVSVEVCYAGANRTRLLLSAVVSDVIQEDRELRRAMAKASLREGWLVAGAVGEMSDEEIEQEMSSVRAID